MLAGLLTELKASEKTVQQLQTQPSFTYSIVPSWPVHVLARSGEILLVSGPGRQGLFHCRCFQLLRDTQHLWALLSLCFGDLLGASFVLKYGPRALGQVRDPAPASSLLVWMFLVWMIWFYLVPGAQMPRACSCCCRGWPVSWG